MQKLLLILFLSFVSMFSSVHAQEPVTFARSSLTIETADGAHGFTVELAETEPQRERGLMLRREMAPDAGMLFLYPRDRTVTMWMANTYLPLDMLFIEADGRIARIVRNAIPQSRTLISSRGKVRAVLELNAGTVRRLGIAEGDRVVHENLR
jgi:uncharacterized membrane protein (UPF0127 family)